MKRCVLVIGATLAWMLLTHIIVGQDQRGGGEPKFDAVASGMLRRAVGKARRCPAYAEKFDDGKPATIKEEEVAFAKDLEIPLVFSPGRFQLEQKPDSETREGKREAVIAFKPWGESRALEAPASKRKIDKVLDQLFGTVHIDPESENITRIYGNFAGSVWLRRPGWKYTLLPPANLTTFAFKYSQGQRGEEWLPTTLKADAKLEVLRIDINRTYDLRFDCGK